LESVKLSKQNLNVDPRKLVHRVPLRSSCSVTSAFI